MAQRKKDCRNIWETLFKWQWICFEFVHHMDPVTALCPYLSLQLRNLILQGEHSISTRRLQDQVVRVGEGNASVRTNMEEVEAVRSRAFGGVSAQIELDVQMVTWTTRFHMYPGLPRAII